MFAKGGSTSSIFHATYNHWRVSKQMLSQELGLSLPTVTKGLRALEDEGFVERRGMYGSTGGRPATTYELVADAKCAIGVELVAKGIRVAVVDLYGSVLSHREEKIDFCRNEAYFSRVEQLVSSVADGLDEPRRSLLGTTIAIQGIVDESGRVTFGGLLGADDVQVSYSDFGEHMPSPLRLVHDAEAAAYAEMWRHREMPDFAFFSLNDHLGSAIVRSGELLRGGALGAGIAEHMVLQPSGRPCYCGGVGCAETLLGARELERSAGMNIEKFFKMVRDGDERCERLWSDYLKNLALLIHNVRMVACSDILLGGRLARYINDTDMRVLKMHVRGHGVLASTQFRLVRGQFSEGATVIGAGLLLVDKFLRCT